MLGNGVVPLAGIEPALLAELDFESSASTNSATGAFARLAGRRRSRSRRNIAGGDCRSTRVSTRPEAGMPVVRTPWPGWRLSAGANATGAGDEPFPRRRQKKHSGVIVLHLDSATRAG